MPTCPNDASEMVSTEARVREGRNDRTGHGSRCCPTCGYSE